MTKAIFIAASWLMLMICCISAPAVAAASNAEMDGALATTATADTIPPGTTITMSNWQSYQQFMSDGMVALFAGKYFWKMPPDVAIEVGPTVIHPLPKSYLAATEKYGAQTKVVELPDGGLTLQGYQGGIPFPDPQPPHQGWKILADLWYRYMPHTMVDSYGAGCGMNSAGATNCFAYSYVIRQLSFNTDPGIPQVIPGGEGRYFTEWFMFLEPEQDRYTTSLTVDYADPARPEELYIFLPALRRYQPLSTAARCAPSAGVDATAEDYRFGFDSNITELKVDVVAHRKILMLLDANLPAEKFPAGFDMPLGWPTPSWGKWQVRDADVISASKIPAKASGYCYGKRVMYVDRQLHSSFWQELYDAQMRLWKFDVTFPRTVDVPGVGPADSAGTFVENLWDIQHNHATFSSDPAEGRPFYVNERAPGEFSDIPRYTTPAGLNMIMR